MNTLNDVATVFPDLFASHWTADLDCGGGWAQLASDGCDQLDALRHSEQADLKIHHIGCNFGGLRIWAEPATPKVRAILEWTERLSRYLCKHCANPGSFSEHRSGVWLTLCTDCTVRERERIGGQC